MGDQEEVQGESDRKGRGVRCERRVAKSWRQWARQTKAWKINWR